MNFQALDAGGRRFPSRRGTFGVSLGEHMSRAVDSRLAGKTAATTIELFSTITHADVGPFVRNTSFWAANLGDKLTCMYPSRSGASLFGLGTVITPRHILYHKHGTTIADGETLRFVTAADAIVLRTQDHQVPTAIPDFRVGLLSSDLPATIVPCPVVDDDFRDYLLSSPRYAVMILDQEGKVLVHDGGRTNNLFLHTYPPTDSKRLEFYEALVLFDSGRTWMGIINDELVLMCVTYGHVPHPEATLGNLTAGWVGVINAAIVAVDALGSVSTGYTVSHPDLSMFAKVR